MWFIISKLLVPKGFSGITVFPFVFTRDASKTKDRVFGNHEKIHLRQQLEMLVILFFIWYAVEFLVRLWQYRNRHKAYRNVSFEREAYANEETMDYLEKRPFFSFLKYL